MSIREIVRDIITDEPAPAVDDEILALIPRDRWFTPSGLDEANRPTCPFAVIRFGATTPGMAHIRRGSAEIWVHDEPGTYATVDRVIALVRGRLDGVEHRQDSDGNELMSADWVSDSGDLTDPGFRTIARTTSYNLIGKGV